MGKRWGKEAVDLLWDGIAFLERYLKETLSRLRFHSLSSTVKIYTSIAKMAGRNKGK